MRLRSGLWTPNRLLVSQMKPTARLLPLADETWGVRNLPNGMVGCLTYVMYDQRVTSLPAEYRGWVHYFLVGYAFQGEGLTGESTIEERTGDALRQVRSWLAFTEWEQRRRALKCLFAARPRGNSGREAEAARTLKPARSSKEWMLYWLQQHDLYAGHLQWTPSGKRELLMVGSLWEVIADDSEAAWQEVVDATSG